MEQVLEIHDLVRYIASISLYVYRELCLTSKTIYDIIRSLKSLYIKDYDIEVYEYTNNTTFGVAYIRCTRDIYPDDTMIGHGVSVVNFGTFSEIHWEDSLYILYPDKDDVFNFKLYLKETCIGVFINNTLHSVIHQDFMMTTRDYDVDKFNRKIDKIFNKANKHHELYDKEVIGCWLIINDCDVRWTISDLISRDF